MNKLKKLLAVVLAVVMVCISFAACSKSAEKTDTTKGADASDTAAADSDYQYIKDKGKLVVGITEYAPMDYKEKGSDEWVGFDADLGKAVAEKMGVDIEFVVIDWDNKFLELETKAIDCVWNGMTITDEVKNNTSVTKAYAMNKQVVVMNADKASKYTTVKSLADLSFAVENGSSGQGAAESNKLNSTAVATQADTLLEVKSGAADACIIDSTMAEAMTGKGTDYENLAVAMVLTDEQYGIGFRKNSDMTEKMNSYIEEFKKDGTLKKLSEKYNVMLAE